jgi:hypothetical protein
MLLLSKQHCHTTVVGYLRESPGNEKPVTPGRNETILHHLFTQSKQTNAILDTQEAFLRLPFGTVYILTSNSNCIKWLLIDLNYVPFSPTAQRPQQLSPLILHHGNNKRPGKYQANILLPAAAARKPL